MLNKNSATETSIPQDAQERRDFAQRLIEQAPTHEQWLFIVRFGRDTLLKNQPLLIEVVGREAIRECERLHLGPSSYPEQLHLILRELNFTIAVSSA